MSKIGLRAALLTVFSWAIFNVFAKFSSSADMHPIVLVSFLFVGASFSLFMIAGSGPLGIETLKKPKTILYSLLTLLQNVVYICLVSYVSATEATLIARLNFIFALVVGLFYFNRIPRREDIPAAVLVFSGCAVAFYYMETTSIHAVVGLLALNIFLLMARTFTAETHETNNEAGSFRERVRVTAYVNFVTTVAFLFFVFGFALYEEVFNYNIPISFMPEFDDFFNLNIILVGFLFGVTIEAMTIYNYFVAARYLKSELFLALTAFVPLITFLLEKALEKLGVLETSLQLTWHLTISAGFIFAGAIVSTYGHYRKAKDIRKIPAKIKALMDDAKDHVRASLIHFEKNEELAAEALGIKLTTLKNIKDDTRTYKEATYKRIKDNYSQNVTNHDPITGLQNRLRYLTKLDKRMGKAGSGMLFFVDLNKFKPINDTHGHATGDAVLNKIGERLCDNYGHEAEMTRIGGDEFSLFFYKFTEPVENVAAHIKEVIAEHIHVVGIEEPLMVTASVGHAHYPNDAGTAEELLSHADKNMYKEKSER
ncbi:MAG: diguanylate cyclase [Alphaproteobacteria bacterium]|nr:diguanylate cyclase [Alphaproteobacteria bacterium]